jgi:hypothetical protein
MKKNDGVKILKMLKVKWLPINARPTAKDAFPGP